MGKELTTIRMLLSSMVGAVASGFIQLSFSLPSKTIPSPSDPPAIVEPRARKLNLVRGSDEPTETPALLTDDPPTPQRIWVSSNIHRASGIRPAANEGIAALPQPTAAVPRSEEIFQVGASTDATSPVPLSNSKPRRKCVSLLKRLGRGLRRRN
ncbi:MAG: hypothetical protein IH991_07365 [Planctomycetes bacterium]|nr:hypothetical protein [Planctomycetota bacterium]